MSFSFVCKIDKLTIFQQIEHLCLLKNSDAEVLHTNVDKYSIFEMKSSLKRRLHDKTGSALSFHFFKSILSYG